MTNDTPANEIYDIIRAASMRPIRLNTKPLASANKLSRKIQRI